MVTVDSDTTVTATATVDPRMITISVTVIPPGGDGVVVGHGLTCIE